MNERLYDNGYDPPYRGDQPPGNRPAGTPPAGRKRNGHIWLTVLGAIAAAAGFLLLYTPVIYTRSVSEIHSVCDSALGLIAQGMYSQLGSDCSAAGNWFAGGMVLLWGGVAAAVAGGVWWIARTHQ